MEGGAETETTHGGMLLTSLVSYLSYSLQDFLPRGGTTNGGLGPFHISRHSDLLMGLSEGGSSSAEDSVFPAIQSLCHVGEH